MTKEVIATNAALHKALEEVERTKSVPHATLILRTLHNMVIGGYKLKVGTKKGELALYAVRGKVKRSKKRIQPKEAKFGRL